MTVRNRLREIRHLMMVDKQIEMAALLGIDEKQYNRYEKQATQPSLETAILIAKVLGKHVEEIFFVE